MFFITRTMRKRSVLYSGGGYSSKLHKNSSLNSALRYHEQDYTIKHIYLVYPRVPKNELLAKLSNLVAWIMYRARIPLLGPLDEFYVKIKDWNEPWHISKHIAWASFKYKEICRFQVHSLWYIINYLFRIATVLVESVSILAEQPGYLRHALSWRAWQSLYTPITKTKPNTEIKQPYVSRNSTEYTSKNK